MTKIFSLIIGLSFAIGLIFISPIARANDFPGCAHTRAGGRCGYDNTGTEIWVVNARKDKSVKVTVKETLNGQPNNQIVVTLPAGGEKLVGCTAGLVSWPPGTFTYTIVGCEVLK